jgi:hypothetical protein
MNITSKVKPVNNGHPWDLKMWLFCRGLFEKDQWEVGFRLAVTAAGRLLLTGGSLFSGGC